MGRRSWRSRQPSRSRSGSSDSVRTAVTPVSSWISDIRIRIYAVHISFCQKVLTVSVRLWLQLNICYMYSFLQSTPQYSLCLMHVLISPYPACTDLCEYNQSYKNIWSKYKPVAYLITQPYAPFPPPHNRKILTTTTTITHQPPSNVTLTTSTTNNESLNYIMVMMIMMMIMMMMMMIIRAKLTTGLSYLNMNTKLNDKVMIIINT